MMFADVESIEIPEGNVTTISSGDIVLWSASEESWDYISTPLNGADEGYIPCIRIPVTKGQTVTIAYLLTRRQGYIYDGRKCGLNYYGSVSSSKYPMAASEVGVETTITISPTSAGNLFISSYYGSNKATGTLDPTESNRCYGKYIKVRVS